MKKIVKFLPAFDKRKEDYGIHGVELLMVLVGLKGAVQFVLYTNWQLPHIQKEQDAQPIHGDYPHFTCHPTPADLGYHSSIPLYEGQAKISDDCEYIKGPCYYDGSSLNAEPIYQALLREGDRGVWKALKQYYEKTFGG